MHVQGTNRIVSRYPVRLLNQVQDVVECEPLHLYIPAYEVPATA